MKTIKYNNGEVRIVTTRAAELIIKRKQATLAEESFMSSVKVKEEKTKVETKEEKTIPATKGRKSKK